MASYGARQMAKRAADYIRRNGWCQGPLEKEDGSVCAVGAMRKVRTRFYHRQAYIDLRIEFEDRAGMTIGSYNDRVAESKEDVLKIFDEISMAYVRKPRAPKTINI